MNPRISARVFAFLTGSTGEDLLVQTRYCRGGYAQVPYLAIGYVNIGQNMGPKWEKMFDFAP